MNTGRTRAIRGVLQRGSKARAVLRPGARRSDWGMRAMVLVQAIALAVAAGWHWPALPAAVYRTLGQEAVPVAAGAIRVVPDASMALTDWNALLHLLHLRIVGGPDESGAYTVAPMGSAKMQRLLQQLRAAHGIKLAEPLPAAR